MNKYMRIICVLFGLVLFNFTINNAYANPPKKPNKHVTSLMENIFPDEKQEREVRKIFEQVRCVVCQNESINESQANIALSMRNVIRKMYLAKKSEQEILDFLESRYGAFILLKPPVNKVTYVLWFSPVFILLIGILLLMRHLRQSYDESEYNTVENDIDYTADLSVEKQEKLQKILKLIKT